MCVYVLNKPMKVSYNVSVHLIKIKLLIEYIFFIIFNFEKYRFKVNKYYLGYRNNRKYCIDIPILINIKIKRQFYRPYILYS